MPIREVKGPRYNNGDYIYRQRIWQGAYVFGLTPEDGIELKGTVSHFDDYEEDRYYYYSPHAIKRSLYMDDVLYTISSTYIKMNNLEDLDEEIEEVKLPYDYERYWEYAYY